MAKRKGKELNFELNLIPFIDVLSACICFLLITVVWIHISSLDVTQALDAAASSEKKNTPAVWAYLTSDGQVTLKTKNVKGVSDLVIAHDSKGVISWKNLSNAITSLHAKAPTLTTVLIMPAKATPYNDLIQVMDQFKKNEMKDIGISPI